jgi:hypothetical protein
MIPWLFFPPRKREIATRQHKKYIVQINSFEPQTSVEMH